MRNISNPAAFAVEWTDEGTGYQLVNPRGTTELYLGMKHEHGWTTTPVVNPDRFGLVDPPKTQREFAAIAASFTNPEGE